MSIDMKLGDCMDLMRGLPDKSFDLAIVDPPYGMARKMDGTGGAGRVMRKWHREGPTWDVAPDAEYFKELERVAKHRIIWGANNFLEFLPSSTNFIFWYKHQPAPNFADGELAWTDFDGPCFCLDFPCFGAHGIADGGKIHPTEKPVEVYKRTLTRYAKPGWKILDTHGGSGSIAIACHDLGFDLTWIEKDPDYYEAATKRYQTHAAQLHLFDPVEEKTPEQGGLF